MAIQRLQRTYLNKKKYILLHRCLIYLVYLVFYEFMTTKRPVCNNIWIVICKQHFCCNFNNVIHLYIGIRYSVFQDKLYLGVPINYIIISNAFFICIYLCIYYYFVNF